MPPKKRNQLTAENIIKTQKRVLADPTLFSKATSQFSQLGMSHPNLHRRILNMSAKALGHTNDYRTLELMDKFREDGTLNLLSKEYIVNAYKFYHDEFDKDATKKQLYPTELDVFNRTTETLIRFVNARLTDVNSRRFFATEPEDNMTDMVYKNELRSTFNESYAPLIDKLGEKHSVILRLLLLYIHLYNSLVAELIRIGNNGTGLLKNFKTRAKGTSLYIIKLIIKHLATDIVPKYQDEIIAKIDEEKAEAELKRLANERAAELKRLANEKAVENQRLAILQLEENNARARMSAQNLIKEELTKTKKKPRTTSAITNNIIKGLNSLSLESSPMPSPPLSISPTPSSSPALSSTSSSFSPIPEDPSSTNVQELLASIKGFKDKYSHLSMGDIVAILESEDTDTYTNNGWKTAIKPMALMHAKYIDPAVINAYQRGTLSRTLLDFIQELSPKELADAITSQLPILHRAIGDSNIYLTVRYTVDSVYIEAYRTNGKGGGAGGNGTKVAHVSFHMGTDSKYNSAMWQHIHIRDDEDSTAGYTININRVPSYIFTEGKKLGKPSANVDKLKMALSSIIVPVKKSRKRGGRLRRKTRR
jgi:hypothetical protein